MYIRGDIVLCEQCGGCYNHSKAKELLDLIKNRDGPVDRLTVISMLRSVYNHEELARWVSTRILNYEALKIKLKDLS